MNRGAYVLRRVLLLIPTLLAIYTLTFLLIHATPGSPWSEGEKPVHPVVLQRLNEAYGLDDPLWKQYTNYLVNALQGDFGPSFTQRSRTVTDIIGDTFPVSIALGVTAMAIAMVVGVTLGTFGAIRHNSWVDYTTGFVAIVGISTPSYVIVSLLVLIFSSELGWLPTGGWNGVFSTTIIIPAIALSLYPAAVLARYTRSSMLDVLSADYVRTARAKGLSEHGVIIRHAIRNALIPVLTVSGIILADVITGSFFVESVYSVPGLGRYFVSSITQRDYPVILGTVLLFGFVISVMNLIVDLLYPLLDPRLKFALTPDRNDTMQVATTPTGAITLETSNRAVTVAGFWTSAWRQFRRNRLAAISLGFILAISLIAIFVPPLLPQSYSDQDLSASLQGPSWAHPAGTDALGRDLMTRLIYGARISLTVGIVVQIVILAIGVPLGLLAGYKGGKVDTIIMRSVDVLYAMPNLLFVILIMTFLRGQFGAEPNGFVLWLSELDARTGGLIGVYIGLGLVSWLTVARIVRANTMSLKEKEYVEAARGLGAPGSQIVRKHLLPNTVAPIVVAATLGIPGAILYESGISFLGLGVIPPMPSWGLMISDAIPQMRSHPYMLIYPAAILSLTVLAFNFIGDGLRDALDPWMKR